MTKVVGVQFKPAGKIYYFLPGDLELKIDDHVIVETIRGVEYASIRQVDKNIPDDEVEFELKSVIRLATEEDAEIKGRRFN